MKNFDDWEEFEGASEGSGRSEKVWLISKDGNIGLFKYTKSSETKEHISERLASDIANLIHLECAEIELGTYQSREGCMSHLINNQIDEILIEGIYLINREYPYYNPETLYDNRLREYYSIEMIMRSLNDEELIHNFIKIIIFDFIIGNSDRHQNNWAVLQSNQILRICPLYDNGSSLCCYIEEKKIDTYLGKDLVRFNSLVNSKSRSRIRVDKLSKKEPTHLEVIEHIKDNYLTKNIESWIKDVIENFTSSKIDYMLSSYNDEILSMKRKLLIKKFLCTKIDLLKQVFIGKEE